MHSADRLSASKRRWDYWSAFRMQSLVHFDWKQVCTGGVTKQKLIILTAQIHVSILFFIRSVWLFGFATWGFSCTYVCLYILSLGNGDVQWPLVRFTLVKRPFVMKGDDHILLLFVKICEQKAKCSTMQRSTISSFSKEIVANFFIGNLSPLHD